MGTESSSDAASFDNSVPRPPQNMRYQSAFYRLPLEIFRQILASSHFTLADFAKCARIHPRFLEFTRDHLYRTIFIIIDEIRSHNPGLNLCFYPEGSGDAARYSYSIDPVSLRLFQSFQTFPHLAKSCHNLVLRCTYNQKHRSNIISPIDLFQFLLNTMPDLDTLRFEDYPCLHDVATRLDAYNQIRISTTFYPASIPTLPTVSVVCHSWSIPNQTPFPSLFRISSLALIVDLRLKPKLFSVITSTSTHSLTFLAFDLDAQLHLSVFPSLQMLIILAFHQGLERYLFSMLPGLGSLQYLTLVGRERTGKEFEQILAGNYLSNSLPPQLVSLIFLDDTPTPLSLYNLAINLKPTHFHFVHWPNHDQPSFSITKQAFLSMGVSVIPLVNLCCELNHLNMNQEHTLI